MANIKNDFLSTLVFLTRLPIKLKFEYSASPRNLKYFPLIGIIVGFLSMIVGFLSNLVFGSGVASILTALSLVVLTGGLHLDGLSDSFDGLYSYRDKEKIIEIMKDSRIGAMGLLAVLFNTLLKIAFIQILLESGNYFVIMLIPFAGRISLIVGCFKAVPMAKSKMGEPFIGRMNLKELTGVLFLYILGIVIFLYSSGTFNDFIPIVMGLLLVSVFTLNFRSSAYKKIDGISGDILGAMCEISETVFVPGYLIGVYLCNLFIL